MINRHQRHRRPYSARMDTSPVETPINRGAVYGGLTVIVCGLMGYPALFVLFENWLGYPFIYNYFVALPIAVFLWIMAKRHHAPKPLLLFPLFFFGFCALIILVRVLDTHEAVVEVKLHQLDEEPEAIESINSDEE